MSVKCIFDHAVSCPSDLLKMKVTKWPFYTLVDWLDINSRVSSGADGAKRWPFRDGSLRFFSEGPDAQASAS